MEAEVICSNPLHLFTKEETSDLSDEHVLEFVVKVMIFQLSNLTI